MEADSRESFSKKGMFSTHTHTLQKPRPHVGCVNKEIYECMISLTVVNEEGQIGMKKHSHISVGEIERETERDRQRKKKNRLHCPLSIQAMSPWDR